VKISIMMQEQAECYVPVGNEIMISITEPKRRREVDLKDGFLAVHRAYFNDIDRPYDDYLPMQTWDADGILQFAKEWLPKAEHCIVHCAAGISRSPAVAIALAEIFDLCEPAILIERYSCFNRHVYRTLMQRYHESLPSQEQ